MANFYDLTILGLIRRVKIQIDNALVQTIIAQKFDKNNYTLLVNQMC